jgi:hypothetical protein
MRPRFSLTLLVVLISLSAFAQVNKAEQQILNLSQAKFGWMVQQQLDSLSQILDERVRYGHSNGWVQTKQEVLSDFKSGKLVYSKVVVTDASVRLYKNTAIVMGKGKFDGSINNVSFSLDLLYTEVYVKKGKQWLLATRHANKMP